MKSARLSGVLSALLALAPALLAQQDRDVGDLVVPVSEDTPPEARDPAAQAIEGALRRARAELEALDAKITNEAETSGTEAAEIAREIASLRTQETAMTTELRDLQKQVIVAENELIDGRAERDRARDEVTALAREIEAQAKDFSERFERSLLAAEDPSLLARAQSIREGGNERVVERTGELLDLYLEMLERSRGVAPLEVPLQLSQAGGRIEKVDALRLGLVAGYYLHPASMEAGLILSGEEGQDAFRGESLGLSTSQRSQIAALVQDPAGGGLVPIDVTGGAGTATLQGQVSFAKWFETGGPFMWALLVIAVIAIVLVIERAVRLAVLSTGIRRRTSRILDLVRRGELDRAEAACERMRGPVGRVLQAALTHRGAERSVLEDAVQESLLHHGPLFSARLSFIALCAAISPLVGLLGTVTGMITTFKMITLFGTSDPRFMAGGISEALITTQGGLYVAIPALIFRGVLGSIAENAVGKLEAGAMSVVLGILQARGEDAETRTDVVELETGDVVSIELDASDEEEPISDPDDEFDVLAGESLADEDEPEPSGDDRRGSEPQPPLPRKRP